MATFTIYLLRESVKTARDAVVDGAREHPIEEGLSKYGQLFVKDTKPKPPKWAELFESYIDKKLLGTVQSSSAAFIIPVDQRLFAITFGQGRFLLHPDAYEERFGLNRPGFRRHLAAINYGLRGGGYEHEAVHR